MDKSRQEDQFVNNLMKHSLEEMPFQDFEERMMDKIHEEKQKEKSVSGSIRLAWLFFFLGLSLGLVITYITANLDQLIVGIPVNKIGSYLQIGIVILLLFQLDKLIDFSFKRKSDS